MPYMALVTKILCLHAWQYISADNDNFGIWHLKVRVDHLCFGIISPGGPIMLNISGPPGPLMPGPFML